MKKVVKYTILSSASLTQLIQDVNYKIEEGFQPQGNHIQTNTIPFMYQQTMVMYEKSN